MDAGSVTAIGFLAFGFLLTLAIIRLALAIADFMDRHDRRPPGDEE